MTRAETEKAARREVEPSRVWLRRAVRIAAVQAQNPETFLARLRVGGMVVRLRRDAGGQLVGYAVAQPGDRDAGGEPVWYSGRDLAGDLALPQLARRWASAAAPGPQLPPEPSEYATVGRAERADALAAAATAAQDAAAVLAAGGEGDGGGIAHAAGDLLTALGQVIPDTAWSAELRERLMGVAEVYDRAARTPRVGQPVVWGAPAQGLRTAAWQLAAVRSLAVRGSNAGGVVMLIAALTVLAAEIAAYHDARARHAQAAAARRAHTELVASRPVDTRPAQGQGPTRPGIRRLRQGSEPAADTLNRPGVSGPPPLQPPHPPPPAADPTRRGGPTR